MPIEILPFVGIGELRFGMSRESCRAKLEAPYESFSRAGRASPEVDSYDSIGMQLSFDSEGKLEFIELFLPSRPRFLDVDLLAGASYEGVTSELMSRGLHRIEDDVGCDFPDAGFGLYAPNQAIEAVSIYRRGYYGLLTST